MRTLVSHIYSFFQCAELNSAFKSFYPALSASALRLFAEQMGVMYKSQR